MKVKVRLKWNVRKIKVRVWKKNEGEMSSLLKREEWSQPPQTLFSPFHHHRHQQSSSLIIIITTNNHHHWSTLSPPTTVTVIITDHYHPQLRKDCWSILWAFCLWLFIELYVKITFHFGYHHHQNHKGRVNPVLHVWSWYLILHFIINWHHNVNNPEKPQCRSSPKIQPSVELNCRERTGGSSSSTSNVTNILSYLLQQISRLAYYFITPGYLDQC